MLCAVLLIGGTMRVYSEQQSVIDWCELFGALGDREACEVCRENQKAPAYYCDCHLCEAFSYGMDEQISDTTWFYVTLDDISTKGLTMYWLSDASVTVDMFVQCTNPEPYMTRVIGGNRQYTLQAEEISEMLEEYGDLAKYAAQGMKLHFRISPKAGHAGRAMAFEANTGFHSTCDDVYGVHYNMLYMMSDRDNVYELAAKDLTDNMFVQFKQLQGIRAEMYLTQGSCDGEAVLRTTLKDSTHVWLADKEVIAKAKEQNEALYFHFASEANGVIRFVSPVPSYECSNFEHIEVCAGKGLNLGDTVLTQSTTYVDSYLTEGDILCERTIELEILPPTVVYDTLYYNQEDLPVLYSHGGLRLREFGDYTVTETKQGECTVEYRLHVAEKVNSAVAVVANTEMLRTNGREMVVTMDEAAELKVFDVLGREVVRQDLQAGENVVLMPHAGNYIVHVVNEKEHIIRKVVCH